MDQGKEIKLPIISITDTTSGLTSALQLTDFTPNEIFTISDSTSGIEIIQITLPQEMKTR